MEHTHDHSHHGHSHSHAVELKNVNSAFIIGIVLNMLFVIIEVIAGLRIHSLSLLSDAGHNLGDVASLGLSLFAYRMMKVKSTATFTYGYKKTTVLVALLNGAILLLSVGAIVYEAIQRFFEPQALPGKTISIIAGIGILINTITALLFLRNKDNDLNIKGAFMHLLADAVVSAGLVVGGIVIFFTGWFWLDPALSIIVAVVIVVTTWQLLKDSLRLTLDGVPQGINLLNVQTSIEKISGVRGFHHIHIWALSTTENALTAHVVIKREADLLEQNRIKQAIKHELLHQKIQHATLETEIEDVPCETIDCV